MIRPAPWQRNMIALAWGITLKASGTMKWTASTTVFMSISKHGTTHSFPSIEADNESDAARVAANMAAQYWYRDLKAQSGFVNQVGHRLYRAAIGNYDNGITKGHTVEILLWPSDDNEQER